MPEPRRFQRRGFLLLPAFEVTLQRFADIFDYDRDGAEDIFIANGTTLDRTPGACQQWSSGSVRLARTIDQGCCYFNAEKNK